MVASDFRGPWFESSHRQKFTLQRLLSTVLKRRNKEKEARIGPFKKKILVRSVKRMKADQWPIL